MFRIKKELQYQFLLLRSICEVATDLSQYLPHTSLLPYYEFSKEAVKISRAVSRSANGNAANLKAYHTVKSIGTQKYYDNVKMNVSDLWKQIIKSEFRYRRSFKFKVMTEIDHDYKSPNSEFQLVKSLIMVDISKIVPIIQVYWMHSIYSMIINVDHHNDLMYMFEEQCKKLIMPAQYVKLLQNVELDCLNGVFIQPLIKIISSYYGWIDRRSFILEISSFI